MTVVTSLLFFTLICFDEKLMQLSRYTFRPTIALDSDAHIVVIFPIHELLGCYPESILLGFLALSLYLRRLYESVSSPCQSQVSSHFSTDYAVT